MRHLLLVTVMLSQTVCTGPADQQKQDILDSDMPDVGQIDSGPDYASTPDSALMEVFDNSGDHSVDDALDGLDADGHEDIFSGLDWGDVPPPDTDGDGLDDRVEDEMGTDPLEQDTDKDGVGDGDEVVRDQTDPLDPSDAVVWQPAVTQRPRLFFGSDDIGEMRQRMASTDGPLAILAERIRKTASTALPDCVQTVCATDYLPTIGMIAQSSAFVGLVENDPAATTKAISLLTGPFIDPAELEGSSNFDIREAEALVGLCAAWDYVAGTPGVSAGLLSECRTNLIARVEAFSNECRQGASAFILLAAQNNHNLKYLSAIGLCAMALSDRRSAATDINEAMTGIDYVLNMRQGTADGGYAEGWHYLAYGGNSFLPFMIAYHRFAVGESRPYRDPGGLLPESPHYGKTSIIKDFAVNPTTRAIHDRALSALRPDGLCPETDDANPSPLHGAILASLFNSPAFLWQWEKRAVAFHSAPNHTVSLAVWPDMPVPSVPSTETEGSFLDAGFAVLRSSWMEDALYVLVQGEHGNVRFAGVGHEHPDELSFMSWARGVPVIIDPGYISFDHHDLVRFPKDHNTILIDGEGVPFGDLAQAGIDPGTEAFLVDFKISDPFSLSHIMTGWNGYVFHRQVVRLGEHGVLVEDSAQLTPGDHQLTLLFNAMAGGDVPDSEFETTDDGARWRYGMVATSLQTAGTDGAASTQRVLEEHATSYGQWGMHERLAVSFDVPKQTRLVTLITSWRTDSTEPEHGTLRLADRVVGAYLTTDTGTYLAVSNYGTSTVQLSGKFDGEFAPGLTLINIPLEGSPQTTFIE